MVVTAHGDLFSGKSSHAGSGETKLAALPLLAVEGESDPHTGDGTQTAAKSGQVAQAAVELGTVIDAWHEDELRVEVDTGSLQPGQIVHDAPGPGIADEGDAQLRVGAVHRDVEGRDVLLLDAPPI